MWIRRKFSCNFEIINKNIYKKIIKPLQFLICFSYTYKKIILFITEIV